MINYPKPEIPRKRRHDLPTYYRLNGAIYLCEINRLKKERSFFISGNIYSYSMDRKSSIDIDEPIDFLMAERIVEDNINI